MLLSEGGCWCEEAGVLMGRFILLDEGWCCCRGSDVDVKRLERRWILL